MSAPDEWVATPRTDAMVARRLYKLSGAEEDFAHFAQTLERDLTTTNAEVARLREVADKLATALDEPALWAFDKSPPESLRAEWPASAKSGALTAGPNNCRSFFDARKEALASYAALQPPTERGEGE
jgi:hypothetical protein